MEKKPTPFPKSRKLSKPDGTIAYAWDGKLHNWEGPALYPEGKKKNGEPAEDPRNGTGKGREENEASKQKKKEKSKTVTKDEWQEARSQREGLPYYKNQSMKSLLSDYRN